MEQYDLIVIGGGFTGVAAAITASRRGRSVLLVERGNCLGGAAVQNLVNPFMPFWTTDGEKKKDYLSCGLFREICDDLIAADAMGASEYTFDEEYLKLLLGRKALAAGVKLLFNTTLTGAITEKGRIQAVELYNTQGKLYRSAAYYADASGDGDLMALSGAAFQLGRQEDGFCQPMTLCFRLGNIHPEKLEKGYRAHINEVYARRQAEGKITNLRENVLIFPTICDSVMHFNTTRIVQKNPTCAEDITQAELDSREQVYEILHLLREEIPGFEDAVLLSTAARIGARESRRLVGLHTLTQEEEKACTVFEDSIAVCNYDIDIHNPAGSGTSHYYFQPGEYYTIPYRCLVPKNGPENLIVGGRCVSATHEAQASLRCMPTVCTLGEACGAAVVAAWEEQCSFAKADVKRIQALLKENKARIF